MKRKPWPLVILAILHFLAPVGNIIVNSLYINVSISTYIHALYLSDEWIKTLIFLLAPILGGILIYICKRWSYYLYLSLMVVPCVYGYFFWLRQPSFELALYLILAYLINLTMVVYFMLPQVRQVYFDPRLRWWETKPRFEVEVDTEIFIQDQVAKGYIKNISEGGVFVETSLVLKVTDNIRINFKYKDTNYMFNGNVVFIKNLDVQKGYGIKLVLNDTDIKNLKKLINIVSEESLIMVHRIPGDEDTFEYWIKKLFNQKKGLLPETVGPNKSCKEDVHSEKI
jgi:hypothetical protein